MSADIKAFPIERIARRHFRPRLANDELAQIGNPELLLSDALARVHMAAAQVSILKGGEQGEADCIREVLKAFRGADWVKFADSLMADDGA